MPLVRTSYSQKIRTTTLVQYYWISIHIVTMEFLPSNATNYLQPMDAGVINSFKAQYRKMLVEHKLDCFMNNENPEIDVYQAVKMLECAWTMEVTSSNILHCWRHTRLIILRDLDVRTTWSHAEDLQEFTTLLENFSLITSDMQVSLIISQWVCSLRIRFSSQQFNGNHKGWGVGCDVMIWILPIQMKKAKSK